MTKGTQKPCTFQYVVMRPPYRSAGRRAFFIIISRRTIVPDTITMFRLDAHARYDTKHVWALTWEKLIWQQSRFMQAFVYQTDC